MPTQKIPKYVLHNLQLLNSRAFKATKRRQMRAVMQAVEHLRRGCAYMPGCGRLAVIAQQLDAWQREISEKEWGR